MCTCARPTTRQHASILLFKEILNIVSPSSPRAFTTFPAGDHIFPFMFRVPPTALPASFEGPYGDVRYEIVATLTGHGINRRRSPAMPITIPSTME
eukprot:jgi/Hompol1/3476/HPOL_006591-RA